MPSWICFSKSYVHPLQHQIYFVDDAINPGWKVVRYKEPRSRRVTDALSKSSLSAPGRVGAETQNQPKGDHPGVNEKVAAEPVLGADVVHVMAHEEEDEEATDVEDDVGDNISDGDLEEHVILARQLRT